VVDFLSSLLSSGQLSRPVILSLIGFGVFLIMFILLWLLVPAGDPLKSRRAELGLDKVKLAAQAPGPSLIAKPSDNTTWDKISAIFLPRNEKSRSLNLGRLSMAGYRSLSALATYHTLRTLCMIFMPLLVLLAGSFVPGWTLNDLYPYLLAGVMVGMIGPSYILDKKVEKRLRKLRHALPDALDLLVVCTESGLGINAALLRVAQEIRFIHPEFASELNLTNSEIRAGMERDEALRRMIERSGLEDAKTLVALLIQSLRLGTGLAETLRVYSEDFRDQRMQAAEEAAAKLATKLIFPLVFCFMPAFFIAAVGPAMTDMIKEFRAL